MRARRFWNDRSLHGTPHRQACRAAHRAKILWNRAAMRQMTRLFQRMIHVLPDDSGYMSGLQQRPAFGRRMLETRPRVGIDGTGGKFARDSNGNRNAMKLKSASQRRSAIQACDIENMRPFRATQRVRTPRYVRIRRRPETDATDRGTKRSQRHTSLCAHLDGSSCSFGLDR
jgi:hypothetical protein